jgi:hypothetical protein
VTKSLQNTDVDTAASNVPDIVVFGGDLFKLLSKASSEAEGWMKSTKAMEIVDIGCVVQVTTQQRNADSTYVVAEALTFVHGSKIEEQFDDKGVITGRILVKRETADRPFPKSLAELAED